MLFDAFLRVTQNELVGNEVADVRSNHNDDSKQKQQQIVELLFTLMQKLSKMKFSRSKCKSVLDCSI